MKISYKYEVQIVRESESCIILRIRDKKEREIGLKGELEREQGHHAYWRMLAVHGNSCVFYLR